MKMLCQICNANESKYTCPKCTIRYCSLKCFKSEDHKQKDQQSENEKVKHSAESEQVEAQGTPNFSGIPLSEIDDPLLKKLIQDKPFQEFISSPVIKFHLFIIIEILNDISLTNEYSYDGRLEIVSKKLNNLREGGLENNEYFNQFVNYLLTFLEQQEEESEA